MRLKSSSESNAGKSRSSSACDSAPPKAKRQRQSPPSAADAKLKLASVASHLALTPDQVHAWFSAHREQLLQGLQESSIRDGEMCCDFYGTSKSGTLKTGQKFNAQVAQLIAARARALRAVQQRNGI